MPWRISRYRRRWPRQAAELQSHLNLALLALSDPNPDLGARQRQELWKAFAPLNKHNRVPIEQFLEIAVSNIKAAIEDRKLSLIRHVLK